MPTGSAVWIPARRHHTGVCTPACCSQCIRLGVSVEPATRRQGGPPYRGVGIRKQDQMIDTAPSERKRASLRLLGVLLIGCAISFIFQIATAETDSSRREDGQLNQEFPPQSIKIATHLYFADRQNFFLKSEQRAMHQTDDPVDFGQAIVEALIKGPQKGLVRTIPAGTKLNAIYIDSDNVCYVDLSATVRNNHPGGSNSEMLTIYSVVNSLILNVSGIKRVKILIDGNETPTLAGHINLQSAFTAYMLLIR
jgi:spore germination protein GerM